MAASGILGFFGNLFRGPDLLILLLVLGGAAVAVLALRRRKVLAPGEQSAATPAPVAKRGVGCLGGTVLILIALLLVVALFFPQIIRARGVQAPVAISVREGVLTATVLQVQNVSHDYLPNVTVYVMRSGQQGGYVGLGTLAPGQMRELGGLEWNWTLKNDDLITVTAEGFLPKLQTYAAPRR